LTTYTFSIVLSPEPDGSVYNVTVPALPGCVTWWGTTVEQAVEMARDAISLWVEDMAADGEPIPTEVIPPVLGVVNVRVSLPEAVSA
jgi:predicted RNase H-like HicB family nuclease